MSKRRAVILIGPPGSGKSSIANRLTEDERVTAVETGNLLRIEVEKSSEAGKKIEQNMSSGKIVPTETVKEVVKQVLNEKKEEYVLFDGFPRVPDQINIFFEITRNQDLTLHKVLILQLSDEIILKRLTGRRICERCGTIYNIYFDPPKEENKCARCGGKLKTRKDDIPEIVKERLQYYKENTLKVAEHYLKKFKEKTIELEADKDIELLTEEIKEIIFDKQQEL